MSNNPVSDAPVSARKEVRFSPQKEMGSKMGSQAKSVNSAFASVDIGAKTID